MNMHKGHRQRMRERFCYDGLEGFAAHEVLELLLFYTRSRGNTNPLAHDLLDNFGSLKGVLEARPEQLMQVKGVGEETATLLSMMVPLFRKYQECLCEEREYIRNRRTAEEYCKALLAGHRTERFCVISLSADMKVLGRRTVGEGSLTEVPAYPRLIVETALNYNAYGVILCHNHPGGRAEPSQEDIAVTQSILTVLSQLNVLLLDHIIVSGNEVYSMTQHGHFSPVLPETKGKRRARDSAVQDERTLEE